MWRQEEVVTPSVGEGVGWQRVGQPGCDELKIQASSAVLCTCKAPGQKGGKQALGTRGEATLSVPPPHLSLPKLPLAAAH